MVFLESIKNQLVYFLPGETTYKNIKQILLVYFVSKIVGLIFLGRFLDLVVVLIVISQSGRSGEFSFGGIQGRK